MFYKVIANLSFTESDECYDFFQDCQTALSKSQVINPGQPNKERGHIQIERCFHDQDPTLSCVIIDEQEAPD